MENTRRGVFTAVLTPQHRDLTFNGDLLVRHCRSLLAAGSDGIALLGTTGEGNSFTMEEKKRIIDAVVEGGIPADRLMVGTGSCAYPETVELARYTLEKGINEILLLPPFYYKQVNDEGLRQYFERVIESVGNEDLRICLYHFPKMSGVHLSQRLLEQLIGRYPRQIVGMKDSSGDLDHMLAICRDFPGFQLFAGTERYLLPVLRAGGAGCISATANVTIARAARVFRAWETLEADALQEELTQIRSVFDGLPFIAVLKQYLAHYQQNPDWLPLRPPNSSVAPAVLQKLLQELDHLDFHPEWA